MTKSLIRWTFIVISLILVGLLIYHVLTPNKIKENTKKDVPVFDYQRNKRFVNMVNNVINGDNKFTDKNLLKKIIYSSKILFCLKEDCYNNLVVYELPDYEDVNKLVPVKISNEDLEKFFKQKRYIKNLISSFIRTLPILEIKQYYEFADNFYGVLKNRISLQLSENFITAINKNQKFIKDVIENFKDFFTQDQLDFINKKELLVDDYDDQISVLEYVMISSIHLFIKENGIKFTE